MTVQVFEILLAILFICLAWLHYRNNKIMNRLKKTEEILHQVDTISSCSYLMIAGLTQTLVDKKVLSQDDLISKNEQSSSNNKYESTIETNYI